MSQPFVAFWDTNPIGLNLFPPDPSTGGLTHGGFSNAPSEWDLVRYGSALQPLPGLAIVNRCAATIRKDGKREAGTDGETPTILANNPVVFDFELLIWTPEQLQALVTQALPVLFPSKGPPIFKSVQVATQGGFSGNAGGTPIAGSGFTPFSAGYSGSSTLVTTQQVQVGMRRTPVILSHPSLSIYRVKSMIIEAVTGPAQWRGHNDIFAWRFQAIEFRPRRNRGVDTPTGSTAASLPTAIGAAPTTNSAASMIPSSGP